MDLLGLDILFLSVLLSGTLLAALLPLLVAGKLHRDQGGSGGYTTTFFSISKSVSNGVFSSMVLQLVSHSHMKWENTIKGKFASAVSLSTQLLGFFLAFFLDVYIRKIVEKNKENRPVPIIKEELAAEQKKELIILKKKEIQNGNSMDFLSSGSVIKGKASDDHGKSTASGSGSLQEKNLKLKIPFKDGLPSGHYVSLAEVDHSNLGIPEATLAETPSTEFPPDYGTVGSERGKAFPTTFSWSCHDHIEIGDAQPHYRLLLLLGSVSVHNMFEGLTLGLIDDHNQAIAYFVAILLHAILLTSAISVTLITSMAVNINKMIIYLSIFCTVRPLGVVIGMLVGHGASFGSQVISSMGQSLSAGVFLHITFFSMIPGDKDLMQHFKGQNLGAFVAGGLGVLLLSLAMV